MARHARARNVQVRLWVDDPPEPVLYLSVRDDGVGAHARFSDPTGLAVDAVGAARAAMALQTGFDKKTVLNIRPAFLIAFALLAPASAADPVPALDGKALAAALRPLLVAALPDPLSVAVPRDAVP